MPSRASPRRSASRWCPIPANKTSAASSTQRYRGRASAVALATARARTGQEKMWMPGTRRHKAGHDDRRSRAGRLRPLLRRRVDGGGRHAALLWQLRLRQRMEHRLALVPGALEGQLHDDAGAVLRRILLDRLLQRARRLLVPGQHVVARLADPRQLQPEIDAAALEQV